MEQQFRHEAVPYEGHDDFLSYCAATTERASERDEQLLFLVSAPKIDALRDRLDGKAPDVTFIATDEHGRNPARLITLLDNFRASSEGRHCVGVNEPIFPGRSAAAAQEAQLADSVLNAAGLRSWPLSVLCLYSSELGEESLREMRRSHPQVRGEADNPAYDPDRAAALFAAPLDDPPSDTLARQVRGTDLAPAREFVRSFAEDLQPDRREDLILAVNEVVTNSVQHGGGECRISMWDGPTSVICEVRDAGHITDPLSGRLAPARSATAGRGLWLANHLCDLVQIRSSQAGTVVRLYVDR